MTVFVHVIHSDAPALANGTRGVLRPSYRTCARILKTDSLVDISHVTQ